MRARPLESRAHERRELTRGVRADYAPPVMRLADKVAIVTGGASGIGFAYARRFLAEGARVVIADVADPVAAAEKLDAAGHTLGVRTDVSDAASVRAMVTAAAGRFGRVDVLVNNAAVFAALKPQPFDVIAEDEWDRVMAVAPGLILSDGVQANPDLTGFQSAAVMQARSLRRDAFPEDVEGAVVFLASEDSAFMSGQTLVVDGGSVFSTL
jgi:NAD(P)-dependent dehydrogenase (short-subunit alcohol dehydrogenase family)